MPGLIRRGDCSDDLVPAGQTAPKAADVKGWTALLAAGLAAGPSASALRSYLKKVSVETWDYVNWLTHAKTAIRMDAEIGLKAVEHLLGVFTAARLRLRGAPGQCGACGSYEVAAGECRHCEWVDPIYEPPEAPELSEEERDRQVAEPYTPSSDITTFVTPADIVRASARGRANGRTIGRQIRLGPSLKAIP